MMKISRIEAVLIGSIFLLCGFGFLGLVSVKGVREIQVLKNGISTQGVVVDNHRVWWASMGKNSSASARYLYYPVVEYNVNSSPYVFTAQGIPRHLIQIGSRINVAYDSNNPEVAIKNSATHVYGRLIPKLILNVVIVFSGLYILRKSRKLSGQGSSSIDI